MADLVISITKEGVEKEEAKAIVNFLKDKAEEKGITLEATLSENIEPAG